jgi:DNA-binding NarL/FixJ family response regulator
MVLDLALPDMTGMEVLWQLRSHEQLPRLPVLVFTAMSEEDAAKVLGEIQVQGCITKSGISLDEICKTIEQAIETAQSLVATAA